jgi:hypothetical protein
VKIGQLNMAQNICDLINPELAEYVDGGLLAQDLLDYLESYGYTLTSTVVEGQDETTAYLKALNYSQ